MNIGEYVLDAKSAEALLFVNMRDSARIAKSAELFLFVNMRDNALNAKSAEAGLFVNMGDNVVIVNITGALLLQKWVTYFDAEKARVFYKYAW